VERVYIETTIPSFYHTKRAAAEMVARRNWTREWWDQRRHCYELVTSAAVLEELMEADDPQRTEMVEMMHEVTVLGEQAAVYEIVETYIERHVMPDDPTGDALHLAFASFFKCDHLVTWNCKHLANASKFPHIRVVNTALGLFVPSLVTPLELLAGGTER